MDQSTPNQGFTKPIGGFIVVLAVALFVGGWLYVDMVKNELELKVEAVSTELAAAKLAAREGAEEEKMAAPAEESRQTYAAALGERRFQVDLPEGYHLSFGDGTTGTAYAYVVLDATPENESPIPDMVIRLVSLQEEPYASKLGKDEPGTRLVATADGKSGFWMTGWEDLAWPEFEKVAASFKAL